MPELLEVRGVTAGYGNGPEDYKRMLEERDDLDAIVHLGDYVYEYGNDADRYGPAGLKGVRDHEPPVEMVRSNMPASTAPAPSALHAVSAAPTTTGSMGTPAAS